MQTINIDHRTQFQVNRIIISHFIVQYVILLFMSTRQGQSLIFEDIFVNIEFLKTGNGSQYNKKASQKVLSNLLY